MKFLVALILVAILFVTNAEPIVESDRAKEILLEELSAGKTLFVKFYAPWCTHCKKMKKAWDRLMEDWKDSDVGLVMEIDCTDERGDELEICDFFGIESFPTILYGSFLDLQSYEGGRTYDELSTFAVENLVPTCSARNPDLCDDKMQARMKEYFSKSSSELQTMIEERETKLQSIHDGYLREMEILQEEFEKLRNVRDKDLAAIRNDKTGLKMMLSVISKRNDDDVNDEL